MRKATVRNGVIGICLILGTAGCSIGNQPTRSVQIQRMKGLDGGLDLRNNLTSPVMLDVYNRSIPDEVYSVQ